MKFAEDFDQDLVPEWRDKYLDYKTGKKLVKAVQRAVNRTNGISDSFSHFKSRPDLNQCSHNSNPDPDVVDDTTPLYGHDGVHNSFDGGRFVFASIAEHPIEEVSTTTQHYDDNNNTSQRPVSLLQVETGDPRQNLQLAATPSLEQTVSRDDVRKLLTPLVIPAKGLKVAHHPVDPSVAEQRAAETPKPGRLRRVQSTFNFNRVATIKIQDSTHPIEILNLRQQEFFIFLGQELHKVESFYQEREEAAAKRLEALRQQLHILRQQRAEKLRNSHNFRPRLGNFESHRKIGVQENTRPNMKSSFASRIVPSQRVHKLPHGIDPHAQQYQSSTKEFVKKTSSRTSSNSSDKISYRNAKHRLRRALQEFYRNIELLKSFALLNRTAFRKLNKKYERTINPNARPLYKWFDEHVDTSQFVTSKSLDLYTEAVEDLYTRYFERGNHKLAVGKLRELTKPHGDKSESVLLNGILMGIGLVFAVEGVWDGVELLSHDDEELREQTSYLLQIYAGYFLMLYVFSLFCISCRIWTAYRINYAFIFEFDTRNDLDWRQLSTFPCVFWFLFGGCIWLNFSNWWEFGRENLFLWFPVVLIGITTLIILLPLPVLWWRSRWWFAVAHWRVLFSGLYPVEFRDLFLADMYCSLVYAIADTELFFCLYVTWWDEPIDCSSRNSRLFGFLLALPLIWRVLQCLRRFWDTKRAFPHLANALKYLLLIAVAVMLSLYRIDDKRLHFNLYVFFASVAALYGALWDIFLDFSLFQEGARYTGLRSVLAFDMPWIYYLVIVLDPFLRFGWIPLAMFSHDLQHGTWVAFTVAFLEATRRGVWALFRVENEHCTNIGENRAIRDVPLPYEITTQDGYKQGVALHSMSGRMSIAAPRSQESAAWPSNFPKSEMQAPVRVNTFKGISKILAVAHRQDFVKKKSEVTFEDTEAQRSAASDRAGVALQEALESDEGSDDEIDPGHYEDYVQRHIPMAVSGALESLDMTGAVAVTASHHEPQRQKPGKKRNSM